VGRRGRFIAEGDVVVRTLLGASRFRPESLLLAETRLAKLTQILTRVPDGVPVYAAPQPVLDAVVGFHLHRGVLAVGLRGPEPSAAELLAGLPDRALVVGLVGLANHDNVGGVFRNAAAFGADAVLLDPTCADPLYRKAIRVSVGAALRVPFTRADGAVGMADVLEGAGFEPLALTPRGETRLADLRPPRRAAALFGSEGEGLPDAVLARCRTVRIDMAGGFDSLNVATTSGIVLHRLTTSG
jgi:tRNA G18 (ribose-2'-O)-methylase SpoU